MGAYTTVAVYQKLNEKSNSLGLNPFVVLPQEERVKRILDDFYYSLYLIQNKKMEPEELSKKYNNFPVDLFPSMMVWESKDNVKYYTTSGVPMTDEFKEYLQYFKYDLPDLMLILFSADEFENRKGKLFTRNKLEFNVVKQRINEFVKHLKMYNLENLHEECIHHLYGHESFKYHPFIDLIKSAKDDSFLFVNAQEIYGAREKSDEELNEVRIRISERRNGLLQTLKFKPSWM